MRVLIVLASLALAHGAKLENTYLPPSTARTAGGSGNFLQTPISGPTNYQNTGINQYGNAQIGNGIAQSGNGIAQFGNDYARTGNGFANSAADYNNVNYNFAGQARPERPRAALERNAAILRQDSSNDGEAFSYAYETENGIYAEESGVATNGVEAQGGYSYTGDDGQIYSVRYTADQNGFRPEGNHLPTPPPVPEEILKALEQNARDEAAGIYDDGSYNEGKYAAGHSTNGYNYQSQNRFNNNDDTIVTNAAFSRTTAYNAPKNGAFNTVTGNIRSFNAVNAGNAPSFNGPAGNTPSYSAPAGNAPSYSAPAGNAPSYSAPAGNAPSYSAPAGNTPSYSAPAGNGLLNAGIARNSVEKAYLPPFRGQARNSLRRQQSFNARTGYNY